MKKRIIILICTFAIYFTSFGSTNRIPQEGVNNNIFYSSGKIYVVVAVLLIIFVALAFYLFRIDRKVSKCEKSLSERNK